MSERNYIIGSGNHNTPGDGRLEFMEMWLENTYRFVQPNLVVIVGDSNSPFPQSKHPFIPIPLKGDVGHFLRLIEGTKKHRFNGWTAAVLQLAMTAYANESDFIYKEADCLAFNGWVDLLYSEIGEAGIIFGNCGFMACEQSLFLIRHWYLTEFVRLICGEPAQNCEENLGERMFWRLEQRCPDLWKRFSMGVGRDRPIPNDYECYNAPWFAQKLSTEELAQLKEKGLT